MIAVILFDTFIQQSDTHFLCAHLFHSYSFALAFLAMCCWIDMLAVYPILALLYPSSDAAAPTAPTIPPAIEPAMPMTLVAPVPKSLGTLTVSHKTSNGGNCVSRICMIPR